MNLLYHWGGIFNAGFYGDQLTEAVGAVRVLCLSE